MAVLERWVYSRQCAIPPTVQCGGWFPRGLPGLSLSLSLSLSLFSCTCVERSLFEDPYSHSCCCVVSFRRTRSRRRTWSARAHTCGRTLHRARDNSHEWDPLDARSRPELARDAGSRTDEARSSRRIAIDGGSIGDPRRSRPIRWDPLDRASERGRDSRGRDTGECR